MRKLTVGIVAFGVVSLGACSSSKPLAEPSTAPISSAPTTSTPSTSSTRPPTTASTTPPTPDLAALRLQLQPVVSGLSSPVAIAFRRSAVDSRGVMYVAEQTGLLRRIADGRAAGDPFDHGQDLATPLAKILRIDPKRSGNASYSVPADNPFVGRAGAYPETWMFGLRNPWRFSFDRATGDVWIGDVGQNVYEEIDYA